MRILALSSIVLVSCGVVPIPGPEQCEYQDDSGLCIGVDAAIRSQVNVSGYALLYQWTLECLYAHGYIASLTIPAPVVRIVDFKPFGHNGYYQDGQITVLFSAPDNVFRHEVIHHAVSLDHSHPAFAACESGYSVYPQQ